MNLGPGSVANAVRSTCGLQDGGSHPLQRIRSDQPEQRIENAELRPQPPSDVSLVQPEPCFGEGKQKGLYSVAASRTWPHWTNRGEEHENNRSQTSGIEN
jgi:hypothetical protein